MSKKQSHLLPRFALTKHHVKSGKDTRCTLPASHLFKMVLGSSEPTPGHVSLWPQDSPQL